MIRITLIAVTFLGMYLFSNCASNPSEKSMVDTSLLPTKELTSENLSQMFSEYRFIPLETIEESLIGQIREVIKNNDRFFIKTSNEQLLVFDQNGKFLRKIGNRGRGPEEYVAISAFAVSDDGSTIAISSGRFIIYYDAHSGVFLRRNDVGMVISTMVFLPDNSILCHVVREQEVLFHLNEGGEKISAFGTPTRTLEHRMPFPFTRIDKTTIIFGLAETSNYISYDFSDKTYAEGLITSGPKALYTDALDSKLQEVGSDGYAMLTDFFKAYERILLFKLIGSNTKYLHYVYNENSFISLYSKKGNQHIRCIIRDMSSPSRIDDILFINLSFLGWAVFSSTDDNTILTFVGAPAFMNRFEQTGLSYSNNTKNWGRANTLYNSLNKEDNPVLIELIPIEL